jgi:SAM-dependent methyltransferase
MSWDQYAPFYDWENARTMGRRDLLFWKRFVLEPPTGGTAKLEGRRNLELGCGTGRLLIPLARTVRGLVGVDLSAEMLARARARLKRLPIARRPRLVRGDIRALPFPDRSFDQVLAPYGVLQSLTPTPTSMPRWRRQRGCCGPADVSARVDTGARQLAVVSAPGAVPRQTRKGAGHARGIGQAGSAPRADDLRRRIHGA